MGWFWKPKEEEGWTMETVETTDEDTRIRCLELAHHETPWDEAVRTRANELQGLGLKPIDALHLASAERAETTYFVTCDDRQMRRYAGKMTVLTPADFILLWSKARL